MRTFLEGRIPAQHITEEVQRDVEYVVHNDACLEEEDALDEEEVQLAVLKLPPHHHFRDDVSHELKKFTTCSCRSLPSCYLFYV